MGPHDTRSVAPAGDMSTDGYEVMPLLDAEQVAAVRAIYDRIGLDDAHEWYVSSRDHDEGVGRRVDVAIAELLGPFLVDRFPEHRLLFASFCSKGRRSPEPVWFHHDVTFVDERRHRSMLVWCPLVPCDGPGGVLAVVPGSHRWLDGVRPGFADRPQVTADFQDELLARSVRVPLDAGEAIAIDAAMIHGSGPNETDDIRPALALSMVPKEAEVVHFHLDEHDELSGHVVDGSFFTLADLAKTPVGLPAVEPWAGAVTASDVAAALADAADRA